jgi:hypothetical protein
MYLDVIYKRAIMAEPSGQNARTAIAQTAILVPPGQHFKPPSPTSRTKGSGQIRDPEAAALLQRPALMLHRRSTRPARHNEVLRIRSTKTYPRGGY